MRPGIRVARVFALLALGIVAVLAGTAAVGQYTGDRVYVLNGTSCRIVVMEEHNGYGANPGEVVLVKQGLVNRTPTMLILAGSSVWFGGLHFSLDRLEVRGQEDILIPPALLASSYLGSSLTYELTDRGQLVIAKAADKAATAQPLGLPLGARPTSSSKECAHARGKV